MVKLRVVRSAHKHRWFAQVKSTKRLLPVLSDLLPQSPYEFRINLIIWPTEIWCPLIICCLPWSRGHRFWLHPDEPWLLRFQNLGLLISSPKAFSSLIWVPIVYFNCVIKLGHHNPSFCWRLWSYWYRFEYDEDLTIKLDWIISFVVFVTISIESWLWNSLISRVGNLVRLA